MLTALRTALAVTSGKLSARVIQTLHMGSGSALPGKVAMRIQPDLLRQLGGQITQHVVAITGTNGKSTTAGLISSMIEGTGYSVVHNQLGANMLPGITGAFVQQSSALGTLNADFGVIEVDEASMPAVSQSLGQQITVVTNLFRDQLDRYGELDTTARFIRQGVQASGGKVLLNADDPSVTALADSFSPDMVLFYGVDRVDYPGALEPACPVPFPKEVTDCPRCQNALTYTHVWYGHLGHYHCKACGFARPTPTFQATQIAVETQGSRVSLQLDDAILPDLMLPLPGLFNAYNLLAAAAAASVAGVPPHMVSLGLTRYQNLFGRAERLMRDGKSLMVLLIKNPTGAGEVLKVVTADPKARLLIAINDGYADGRDVSWLWDAPFEWLEHHAKPMVVSGHRADDMAIRLKYAGVPTERVHIEPDVITALQTALNKTAPDETLYILPTYTALLSLSQHLGSR